MPTPTEEGLYYWRFPHGHRWWPVQLTVFPAFDADGEDFLVRFLLLHELSGRRLQKRMSGILDAYQMGGTWGERIPDSPTLKAMREMMEYGWEDHSDEGGCRYCDGWYCREEDADGRQVFGHDPDCPWLRAQEP